MATCTNTEGSFECACPVGYSGDGISCVDDDECVNFAQSGCDTNALCRNNGTCFKYHNLFKLICLLKAFMNK